jgi:hypothetical protein
VNVVLSVETVVLLLLGALPLTDRRWMAQARRYRTYSFLASTVVIAGVGTWLAAAAALGALDGWAVANTVSGAATAGMYLLVGSLRGVRAFVGFSLIAASVTLLFFVDSPFVEPQSTGRVIAIIAGVLLFLAGTASVARSRGSLRPRIR